MGHALESISDNDEPDDHNDDTDIRHERMDGNAD